MKTCAHCLIAKPYSDFRDFRDVRRGHRRYSPRTIHCWECRRRYPQKRLAKSGYLFRKYGLTLLGLEFVYALQDYNCAICDEHRPDPMCMDHDHSTGERRGMLCNHCNTLLDSPGYQRTPEMLAYLDRFTPKRA